MTGRSRAWLDLRDVRNSGHHVQGRRGQDLKVCAYPDKSVVTGYSAGKPVITCVHSDTVPAQQAAASLTVWDR